MRLSSLQTGALQRFSNGEGVLVVQVRKVPPPSIFIIRSGDDWLVGKEEKDALLKAPVRIDPHLPPRTGWLFHNNGKFDEDASLICSKQPESNCCSVTVSLGGEAKRESPWCKGKYESTCLISMGREVNSGYKKFFCNFNMISLPGVQTC